VIDQDQLGRIETVVDRSGVAPRLEALFPIGVRPRQLSVRTLLVGIMAALSDQRPAHLTRVHAALVGLAEAARRRLGVVVDWRRGSHLLTYRQVERTFGLLVDALEKECPDGMPSELLQGFVDDLVEASVPAEYKEATRALAVDWTDVESLALPPALKGEATSGDPEASWGHRRGDSPGQTDELFYGYYLQLATMVREESGPAVPELVRRLLLASCHVDPPPAFIPVLQRLGASGVAIGDVLSDSGYAYRAPEHWALPLRVLEANIVTDLHPNDRGTKGTFAGAICCNGALYCPATPEGLFAIEPLSRGASVEETASHDIKSAELARYKLGRIGGNDQDGYHRVMCPAVMGKVRCPRRESSMALSHDHPEILHPPEQPPLCCTQQTVTVPPSVNAKTAQKHDYPSKAHRLSYGRRSAAERSNATVKDPASNDISRGWCRLMGLSPTTVMLACLFVVRNLRVVDSFEARQVDDARRAAAGLPPKTRRRRRKTLNDLVGAMPADAPP
jgi:hypothetical protein